MNLIQRSFGSGISQNTSKIAESITQSRTEIPGKSNQTIRRKAKKRFNFTCGGSDDLADNLPTEAQQKESTSNERAVQENMTNHRVTMQAYEPRNIAFPPMLPQAYPEYCIPTDPHYFQYAYMPNMIPPLPMNLNYMPATYPVHSYHNYSHSCPKTYYTSNQRVLQQNLPPYQIHPDTPAMHSIHVPETMLSNHQGTHIICGITKNDLNASENISLLPMIDIGAISLHYFDVRRFLGRGGKIQIYLRSKQVKHKYRRLSVSSDRIDSIQSYQEMLRKSGGSPTGELPVLQHHKQLLCETFAILRYLAKNLGEYGRDNYADYMADMFVDKLAYWSDELMTAISEANAEILGYGIQHYFEERSRRYALFETMVQRMMDVVASSPYATDLDIEQTEIDAGSPLSTTKTIYYPISWYTCALVATILDDIQLVSMVNKIYLAKGYVQKSNYKIEGLINDIFNISPLEQITLCPYLNSLVNRVCQLPLVKEQLAANEIIRAKEDAILELATSSNRNEALQTEYTQDIDTLHTKPTTASTTQQDFSGHTDQVFYSNDTYLNPYKHYYSDNFMKTSSQTQEPNHVASQIFSTNFEKPPNAFYRYTNRPEHQQHFYRAFGKNESLSQCNQRKEPTRDMKTGSMNHLLHDELSSQTMHNKTVDNEYSQHSEDMSKAEQYQNQNEYHHTADTSSHVINTSVAQTRELTSHPSNGQTLNYTSKHYPTSSHEIKRGTTDPQKVQSNQKTS